MQNHPKKICIALIVFLFALWALFVLILPSVFNSKTFVSAFSDFFYLKTNNVIYLEKPNLKIEPNLLTKFSADRIIVSGSNQTLNLSSLELVFSPFNSDFNKIVANEVYFQKNGLPAPLFANKNKTIKYNFSPSKIPDIYIKKVSAVLKTNKKTTLLFNVADFQATSSSWGKTLTFDLLATSDYLSETLKINNESKIYITDNGVYSDNLLIYFLNSYARIKGKLYDRNGDAYFLVLGKNLPASDIEKCVLLVLKRINPKRYFIENFRDFKGRLDVALYYENKSLFGSAVLKKFGATTVPLGIPLFFENAHFNFENNEIVMNTSGYFGGEPCNTNFYLTGLFSSNLEISGSINSYVTNNFARKYIEGLFIKRKVFLNVDYYVKNGVVDVIYKAVLDKFSDVYYLKSRLGLSNLKREIVAHTEKREDIITLLKYSYLVSIDNKRIEIISGDGLFTKHKNKKFAIDKISIKTKKDAPVSLLGFIESNLKGGRFNGEIKYDFINSKLDGFLILSDSRFKRFLIKEAAIFAQNNSILILTHGLLNNQTYNAIIELKNSLNDDLFIYKFDIFLKKYEMLKSPNKKRKFKPFFDDIDVKRKINVQKLALRLDEFKKGNIIIKNLFMNGYVKNNVLHFTMNDAFFADGILGAAGFFDFNNKTSVIDFSADNIDAKIASYQVFNIKDHIKGLTSAKLRLEIFEGFRGYKGTAVFGIKEGELTKLGTREFLVKGSRKKSPYKFSLAKIVKIDKKADIPVKANIKGFFNFYGPKISDINIIVQNDLISFYIEGMYDVLTQYCNLNLWGRYDKEFERNISIFHIPLSFVYKFVFKVKEQKDKYFEKLLKIPALKNSKDTSKTFNVQLEGNINIPKSLNFNFKDIR